MIVIFVSPTIQNQTWNHHSHAKQNGLEIKKIKKIQELATFRRARQNKPCSEPSLKAAGGPLATAVCPVPGCDFLFVCTGECGAVTAHKEHMMWASKFPMQHHSVCTRCASQDLHCEASVWRDADFLAPCILKTPCWKRWRLAFLVEIITITTVEFTAAKGMAGNTACFSKEKKRTTKQAGSGVCAWARNKEKSRSIVQQGCRPLHCLYILVPKPGRMLNPPLEYAP